MLPVAILAGGLATRIKPISDSIPKSLIDINGKPFLEWQLQLLEKSNCELVVICISHKSELIEEFLHKRATSQLEIRLSWDGEKQLGTGGALIKAMNLLGPAFMVLYGDSYLPIDYEKIANFFLKENCLALMTIMKNNLNAEISNVIYENGFVKKYNKEKYEESMDYIDFGLNVFKAEAFNNYPLNEEVDLSAIQSGLATRKQIVGYLVNQRYYEVGSFKGIQDFSEFTEGLS
jgi:MurNAc alpha-1-phosphate uridylyltransferase